MHRDHDHDHSHQIHRHDHHTGNGPRPATAGLGHNHPQQTRGAAQWQTPHLDAAHARAHEHGEADLDQVEAAFIEGFVTASDPTSFLRLANVPFKTTAADGAELSLLRVETDVVADVGSVTPHLGGGSFRYDPLPASLISRRRRLRFIYFDSAALRPLNFAEVRELALSTLQRMPKATSASTATQAHDRLHNTKSD